MSYRNNDYIIKNYDSCVKLVKNFKYDYIEKLFKNKGYVNSQCLKYLGSGGQGRVYLLSEEECGKIVIKIIKSYDDNNNELLIVPYVKRIIEDYVSPNFLYIYGYEKIKNYTVIFSEYANGTLEDWLKTKHSYEEWRSFLFQFLSAVVVLQTVLKSYHSDLKPKNIFYKNLINKPVFEYNIQEKKYYVPTHGNLFLISDFGHVQSLMFKKNKLNKDSIELNIKNNIDLEHIIDLHKRIIVNSIEKVYTYGEMLNIIKKNNDLYFDNYLKSKKEEIDKNLSKYPEHVKKKMLYRSVAYYILEKKYIDLEAIPDNSMIMKLPPIKIINEIENWKDHDNILDILETFSEFKNVSSVTTNLIKFKLDD